MFIVDNKPGDSLLFTILLVGVGIPVLLLDWIFNSKDSGPAQAIAFVVAMFLFGSAFFFN